MHFKHISSCVFNRILTTTWLLLAWLCCTAASAATSISAVATPSAATAPANVTLSVVVNADPEPVTVTGVEYFNGNSSLGVATSAPFSLALTNVAAGTYSIVAKATVENPENPVLVSAPTMLTVTGSVASGASVYYIQTDQLNTPRAITDQANALVWKWDSDPFGMLPPNETPVSSTRFTFNPRFPGQYFEKETNLHHNYYRDYEPLTGRYLQSDPIGLGGGINTYGYVSSNPLTSYDPMGLKEYSDSFVGPLPRGGYRTSQMSKTRCGIIPPFPPGIDPAGNISNARHNPWWFRDQVRNGGPMDYKQRGALYQDFGNFNYGAVGTAVGFPSVTLAREAGRAQQAAGTSRPEWGKPGPILNPMAGIPPYGDDPEDQAWIQKGIDYCKCMESSK
ncbi:polymorphic toxin type 44 domain-containing protein [Pseudoduganella sp. LjRoot289]|uniref:RHS repeat-associated core domain-containing protein n=1 Tax=Pseudoduganella sp. LjRoot289 TaxID=3342314 RepID=UPI003ED10862